jgi:hypothetical protein
MKTISYRSFASGLGVMLLAACSDTTGPLATTAPEAVAPARALTAVACTVSVRDESVSCGTPSANAASKGVSPHLVIGGQNTNVKLTSSNFVRTAGQISFDVRVQSLIEQAMGTEDDSTLSEEGVRVFFASGPTPIGGGTVSILNADGADAYLGAEDPYFQYDEILEQGETSAAKTWQFGLADGATDFTFVVYVAAEVPFPNGYVALLPRLLILNPGEVMQVPGEHRNALGRPTGNALFYTTATSTAPTITPTGTITANVYNNKIARLEVSSGAARELPNTGYVFVCPSQVITSGASFGATLDDTCFSALHRRDNYLPGTSYYGDLYRITLQAGDEITINMQAPGVPLDPELVLADPSGLNVADNDDIDAEGDNFDSRIVYTARRTGQYIIQATSYLPGETGAYTLSVMVNGATP